VRHERAISAGACSRAAQSRAATAADHRGCNSFTARRRRSSATFRSGNEALYEAYNALHSLAQDFEKPFDAPAILVVGHQTDGKSGASPRAARVPAV